MDLPGPKRLFAYYSELHDAGFGDKTARAIVAAVAGAAVHEELTATLEVTAERIHPYTAEGNLAFFREQVERGVIRTAAAIRNDGRDVPERIRDGAAAEAEVGRLRAENAALAAALEDIAGMWQRPDGAWVAMAECSHLTAFTCIEKHPDDPGEWCPVCVAEVAWCAWKMGVLT